MPDACHSIFISYARRDGAELALRLQKDLTAANFEVWLDTQRIEGGASWTVEIEEAIDKAEVVLALLTPGSYTSEICRAEQLRSLRKGRCVIPLLAVAGSDIPLHFEPGNYRDFTQAQDYDKSFQLLLGDIGARNGAKLPERYRTTTTAFITTPPTVANYIERPAAVHALRDALFEADGHRSIALTAVEGMGGIGKTVLAQAIVKDEIVRHAFPDGLVWITVGRETTHDFTGRLREITKVLGGASDETVSPETLYRTTIASRAALIVIDDIWSKADLDPFLAESPRSRFLFTTRDASIARFSGAREFRVDLLEAVQSRELLARWASLDAASLPPAADDILRECGGLPLALSIVGALLRGAAPADWADTARLLHNADLTAIEELLPPGQPSFFRAIDVSVKTLTPKMQQQYGRLAMLLEDMPAPLPILETLWNVNEADARRMGRLLADRSLAQRDPRDGISLHDLQLTYLRAQCPHRDALALIHGALRLSSHVIENEPDQFAPQMVGRLLPHRKIPAVQQFIDEAAAGAPTPWLRPLQPALHPPGTALICTLEGHSAYVTGVAMTADGRRAVSASWDDTVKVWDLETGRTLRTLEGHSHFVSGVAVTRDGARAISSSWDRTLKIWDLYTGRTLATLEGHAASVTGVAMTADWKRAVSSSQDRTLKVWDIETGRLLRTLEGHADFVTDVAITADGQRAVSASQDKTLKVWDLDTGEALRTLEGHAFSVNGVALTLDGKRAISASGDRTLKIWDLESGRLLSTLEGHGASVTDVAVTGDGELAISSSWDRTLKLWDLDTGRALRTLEGHCASVADVAITADGKRAVSASWDHALKVWDLDSRRALTMAEGHFNSVRGMAVTQDGKRALVASRDHTLKLWDLEADCALRSLEGHSGFVNSVALTADAKRAISASADYTLKAWDLETGAALRTFEGHSDSVSGVAITPDGKRMVSASADQTVKVWDLDTSYAIRTLEGHSHFVACVAVTSDGKRAVSGSLDRTLKVWDLDTGRELITLAGHSDSVNGVAVTPDGKRAISASADNTLRIWNLETRDSLQTLVGHTDAVNGVALTADGLRAVSASRDDTLKVWDLDSGQTIATFHCDGYAQCCAFAGDRIIAGDTGGRLYVLSLVESTADSSDGRTAPEPSRAAVS